MYIKFTILIFILYITSLCNALECFVCDNQEGNRDKCLKTIKVCDQEQDTCLTEVRWGSTPYWSEGAPKQYYVSKRCSNKRECERLRNKNMPDCTYIWYQDWKCSDCCQGDRCNYYIISSASKYGITVHHFIIATLIGIFSPWILK